MLVGLIGYARSGKDSFANHMVQDYDFVKMAFAAPMREALIRLNPLITISGYVTNLTDAVERMGWEAVKEMSPETRLLLQRFGTEVGREMFGENFWVDMAMQRAEPYSNVVFSDVRFKNEADAIRSAGGTIIRVVRPGNKPVNSHRSETELDGYVEDYLVNNSGSLAELSVKVNVLTACLGVWA